MYGFLAESRNLLWHIAEMNRKLFSPTRLLCIKPFLRLELMNIIKKSSRSRKNASQHQAFESLPDRGRIILHAHRHHFMRLLVLVHPIISEWLKIDGVISLRIFSRVRR